MYYRVDPKKYAVGDKLPASRVWDDGSPTDEILPGTSCTCIESKIAEYVDYCLLEYGTAYVYEVDGHLCGVDGYDDGEQILTDCTIVRLISFRDAIRLNPV